MRNCIDRSSCLTTFLVCDVKKVEKHFLHCFDSSSFYVFSFAVFNTSQWDTKEFQKRRHTTTIKYAEENIFSRGRKRFSP